MTLCKKTCPLYVYDDETLNDTFFDLLCIDAVDDFFYTVSSNPHPKILEKAYKLGIGFKCSSQLELENALNDGSGSESEKLLFAPDFAGPEQYDYAYEKGANVLLNNIFPLMAWPDIFHGRTIFIKVDMPNDRLGWSSPERVQCQLKTGIQTSEIGALLQILKRLTTTVKGLHVEAKPRFPDQPQLDEASSFLARLSAYFPEVSVLSFGNGIGISMKPVEGLPDFQIIKRNFETAKELLPQYEIWLEPGDRIVSPAGVLLTKVIETKLIDGISFARIDSNIEGLIYSALHSLHHEIFNFSKLDEKVKRPAHVIGLDSKPKSSICLTRSVAPVDKDDFLLIANTGAFRFEQGFPSQIPDQDHQHFLKARKICQIKL